MLTISEEGKLPMLCDRLSWHDGVVVNQYCRRNCGNYREPTGLIGIKYTISENQLLNVVRETIAEVYDVFVSVSDQ